MIVTDKFVFLHLHKSGGTFVNKFIQTFFPSTQAIGYHLPGIYIPESFSHLPVFGLVRNPWSYYVSWYTFQAGMPSPNIVFKVVSDNGRLDFNATIQNLLKLSDDPEKMQAIIDVLPTEFRNVGINITKQCMESYKGSKIGFYSFLYSRIFSGADNIHVGKMESLRQDLYAFLDIAGVNLTTDMEAHINLSPKLNITQHKSNMDIYEKETADLVNTRDKKIITQHGYTF